MDTQQPLYNKRQASPLKATFVINTNTAPKKYSPMIFGGFLEHFHKQIYGGVFEPGSPLADQDGFRLDVIEALKELKSPIVRWPGGCFVDSYHWQKGVGEIRQAYDDDRWGVLEPNTFGTHEFIELCRRLKAEPYICQNGLVEVQEMANWVAYCNATTGEFAKMREANGHPKPFNVKFWSIGNERAGMDYIHRVRDGGKAMNKVDNSIMITCSGTHGPGMEWDPYLLKTAGKYLDYISVHEYWIQNYDHHQTPDYLSCIMKNEIPDYYISTVVRHIKAAEVQGLIPEHKIKIAFDEWNLRSWHHPLSGAHKGKQIDDYDDPEHIKTIQARDKSLNPVLYTMADALFVASFYNACLRNGEHVTMANIAPLVNQTGPLYVHPEGIVRRTHFHAMAMYANLLKEWVAKITITSGKLTDGAASVDVVDGIATVDESGRNWAIALVNRHPLQVVDCTVNPNGQSLEGNCKATVLSGETPDSYNDIENPERVVPKEVVLEFRNSAVSLPPHSLTIIRVKTD